MSTTQHDYDAMSKRELVKLVAKAAGTSITQTRKHSKTVLVARAKKLFRPTPAAKAAFGTGTAAAPQATKPAVETPSADVKQHYRLTSNGGSTFLRRDQPRKPGDIPKYRVVEDITMATVTKSKHQLVIKLAEAQRLMGVPVTAVAFPAPVGSASIVP